MDIQLILVIVLFSAAVLYLIRMIYLNVRPGKKGGSCKACNACSDFSQIEDTKVAKSSSKTT